MAADAPPVPQHIAALKTANAYRLRRAEIKREVKAGTMTVRDVLKVHELAGIDTLEDVEPAVATMTIGDLLSLPYRWGLTRTRKLLATLNVPESKRLEELTQHRRRLIVAALEHQEVVTVAEAQRIAEREAVKVRERKARRRAADRVQRDAHARRQLLEDAERRAREAAAARGPVDPIDVACPYCRSEPGDPCSTYDPVRDLWTEPPTHGSRIKRAGMLS